MDDDRKRLYNNPPWERYDHLRDDPDDDEGDASPEETQGDDDMDIETEQEHKSVLRIDLGMTPEGEPVAAYQWMGNALDGTPEQKGAVIGAALSAANDAFSDCAELFDHAQMARAVLAAALASRQNGVRGTAMLGLMARLADRAGTVEGGDDPLEDSREMMARIGTLQIGDGFIYSLGFQNYKVIVDGVRNMGMSPAQFYANMAEALETDDPGAKIMHAALYIAAVVGLEVTAEQIKQRPHVRDQAFLDALRRASEQARKEQPEEAEKAPAPE
jgi:hypothetical protein